MCMAMRPHLFFPSSFSCTFWCLCLANGMTVPPSQGPESPRQSDIGLLNLPVQPRKCRNSLVSSTNTVQTEMLDEGTTVWPAMPNMPCSTNPVSWMAVFRHGLGYVLHTTKIVFVVSVLGFLYILPLTALAYQGYRHLQLVGGLGEGAERRDLGLFERSTAARAGLWPVTAFVGLQNVQVSCGQLVTRWMIVACAWHGWERARTGALLALLVTLAVFLFFAIGSLILMNYGFIISYTRIAIYVPITTLSNYVGMLLMVKLPSETMGWKELAWLMLILTPVEWLCSLAVYLMLIFYYAIQSSFVRVALRVLGPAVIRRVWLHCNFVISMRFDVPHEERRFLLMVLPITSTAAAGAAMQVRGCSETADARRRNPLPQACG